jgi:hypothetical protein
MTDERSVEELIAEIELKIDNVDDNAWIIDRDWILAGEIRAITAALLREKARADEAEKALDTLIAAFASHPVSSIIKAKARKSLAAALSSEQSKEGT